MKKQLFCSLIMFFLLIAIHAEDSIEDSISEFDKNWALNYIVNYNMGIFGGYDSSEYRTDNPFNFGFGIRYKNFSAQLLISLSIFESFDIWAFDFEINSYFDNIYYEAYFKRYPELHEFVELNAVKNNVLDIHSSGIMATFIHNNKNHSLGSVNKLDKKQNISSGSLLYGFGVFHSSLLSTADTINKYKERHHIIYFGPGIGYSYTWVFQNSMFLNSSILFYTNPAVEINTGEWLFIPKLKPNITLGYHDDTWSLNLKMTNSSDFLIWDKDDIEILTLVSITMMFSKRF